MIESQTQMMTRKEVAQRLGVHPNTVTSLEKSGKITAVKITPRTIRFDPKEVDAITQKGAGK